jgi:hypothetical protein
MARISAGEPAHAVVSFHLRGHEEQRPKHTANDSEQQGGLDRPTRDPRSPTSGLRVDVCSAIGRSGPKQPRAPKQAQKKKQSSIAGYKCYILPPEPIRVRQPMAHPCILPSPSHRPRPKNDRPGQPAGLGPPSSAAHTSPTTAPKNLERPSNAHKRGQGNVGRKGTGERERERPECW